MPRNRLWIGIVMLGTAIACAVALLLATLGAAAGAASGESEPAQAATQSSPQSSSSQTSIQQQSFEGMVTCSRCGAKHSPLIARSASDCVRVCVHGGAKFALIDGDTVYILDGDLDQLKKVAGQRATIVGAMSGNIITVSSVVAGA